MIEITGIRCTNKMEPMNPSLERIRRLLISVIHYPDPDNPKGTYSKSWNSPTNTQSSVSLSNTGVHVIFKKILAILEDPR